MLETDRDGSEAAPGRSRSAGRSCIQGAYQVRLCRAEEAVEGVLLGAEGVLLEVSVHAFVPGVLLGLTGLDELGSDAEPDPPDGELGEASEGGGGEGMTVVGADALGEAELAEEVAEAANGGLKIEAEHAAALEEEAGVAVLNGERKAEATVAGAKLALEVGAPGGVGLLGKGERRIRVVVRVRRGLL
jgi:hypothetical protein